MPDAPTGSPGSAAPRHRREGPAERRRHRGELPRQLDRAAAVASGPTDGVTPPSTATAVTRSASAGIPAQASANGPPPERPTTPTLSAPSSRRRAPCPRPNRRSGHSGRNHSSPSRDARRAPPAGRASRRPGDRRSGTACDRPACRGTTAPPVLSDPRTRRSRSGGRGQEETALRNGVAHSGERRAGAARDWRDSWTHVRARRDPRESVRGAAGGAQIELNYDKPRDRLLNSSGHSLRAVAWRR